MHLQTFFDGLGDEAAQRFLDQLLADPNTETLGADSVRSDDPRLLDCRDEMTYLVVANPDEAIRRFLA